MKKTKLFAGLTTVVLSVMAVLSLSGTATAYAEDVADKVMIDLAFENKVGEKKISAEDANVIIEEFGYTFGNKTVNICAENTSAYVNWENSSIPYEDVYETIVFCPVLSRDENGNLIVQKEKEKKWELIEGEDGRYTSVEVETENEVLKNNYYHSIGWYGSKTECYARGEGSGFSLLNAQYYVNNEYLQDINESMGLKSFIAWNEESQEMVQVPITDVYIVRFCYTTDGKGNYYKAGIDGNERTYGYLDYWILPEGVDTILNLEEIEEDTTPSSEQYIVDLADSTTPVTKEVFAALLEENKTKDIVINSNNGVSFTFRAGTMSEVDGKEAYDFSTTINNTYTDTMPSYITKNNFVTQLNFNYSGKLPAEAYIRFSVGTQYAGKTLYYFLMNEDNTFAEVQSVIVDEDGYMTVKQNHCSIYGVTTEQPENVMTAKEVKVSKKSVTYNGKKQTPAITVYDTNGNEIGLEYYSVSYTNNKNVGRATITVELKENYSGTLTATFDINPKSTKISSVSAKKKGFTLKWKKQTKEVTGYQIQYSTNKKFKGAKTVTIKKSKTVQKSISKLKAKKRYYVRIRTYKVVKVNEKNTKFYSNWSSVKNVKTKE